MSDELTPEERLLRLIRGDKESSKNPSEGRPSPEPDKIPGPEKPKEKKPAEAKPSPSIAKKKKSSLRGLFMHKDNVDSANPDLSRLVRSGLRQPHASLRNIERTLILICVCSLVFMMWQHFYQKNIPIVLNTVKLPHIQESHSLFSEERQPIESYVSMMRSRDLFKGFEPPRPKINKPQGPSKDEIMARMTLLGIFLDEKPQAIVQDRRTKSTYYVHEGDRVDEVVVESIQEGSVKFSYQGETFELRI